MEASVMREAFCRNDLKRGISSRSMASSRSRCRYQCIPILLAITMTLAMPTVCIAAPISVDDAVHNALVRNPDFLAAQQQLTTAQARVIKARYWNQFNPSVDAGAVQWRLPGTGSLAEPQVGVSLEVEIAGQRSKRIAEAEQNLAKVRAQVADTQRTLIAQVKVAFYRALYAKEQFALAQRIEALNRRLRDAT